MSIMLKYHLLFLWIQYFVTLYTQQNTHRKEKTKNIYIYISRKTWSEYIYVYSLFDTVGWQNETNESVEGMF